MPQTFALPKGDILKQHSGSNMNLSCFFQSDTLIMQAADCQATAPFCLGILQIEMTDYEVWLNGSIYPDSNYVSCNTNETAIQLPIGTNEVILSEQASGCIDTIVVEVFCTMNEVIEMTMVLGQIDTFCFNGNELPGLISTIYNLCPDGAFVNYEILGDSCVAVAADLVGDESACFVACDADGFCDTTFVHFSILHAIPDGLRDTIIISQITEYCFNENLINILGAIDTFENVCPNSSGLDVHFNLDPISNCIIYEGFAIGTDTACIRVCDNMGRCDTISYQVTVIPSLTEYDTVFIYVESETYCVPDSLLPGEIVHVENICHQNPPDFVAFEINGDCITYHGTNFGQGSACIRVEDELGNVAIVNLYVSVINTTPEAFCDSIFIGEQKEYCLDTSDIPGQYQNLKILFEDIISESVEFEGNPINACISYTGLSLGRDSLAVALCDEFGFCDTTSFCITVIPYFELPRLAEDTIFTVEETPVVIDALANDTLLGGLREYFVLAPPNSGLANINLDGSITYIPEVAFCARWDMFSYVACNPNGCDTTTINVYIECVELTIFNAVSPNNDDVNDYFYIAKIENFPNNRLWVYNRWGNQVFDSGTEGYRNNWPGTWGDDIDLPDGTYYYILEWTDKGETTVQRGYFEMFR